jgi:hypothetical protein
MAEELRKWDHLTLGSEIDDASEGLSSEEAPSDNFSADALNERLTYTCWSGSEAMLDLMMPDRLVKSWSFVPQLTGLFL